MDNKEHSELCEELADLAHRQWSGWMTYMLGKCYKGHEGSLVIPVELVERWTRQMYTPYTELSEAERDSDRAEAYRVMALLRLD